MDQRNETVRVVPGIELSNITFFVTKNRVVKDKKTQIEQNVLYNVCKLPFKTGSPQPCVAFYKHNLANGTKNLQNHLIYKQFY